MTEAEAIKWIDDRMCYGRYTPQKHSPFIRDECCQAGELAIKALEKQIAKKPISTDWLRCPNCNVTLKVGLEKYCEHCGQRLNWEV